MVTVDSADAPEEPDTTVPCEVLLPPEFALASVVETITVASTSPINMQSIFLQPELEWR